MLQDFRQGLRLLCKTPGFSLVAVITLALGIGANTAIFSVVYSVLLRPLPFHDPSRIVAVKTTEPNRHDDIGVSYPVFLDWRSRSHSFEGLSAFRTEDFTLTGKGEPIHVTGGVISANTFSLLGVSPVIGRDFTPSEDAPGTTGLPVVLKRSLWRERFHADPNVLGQSLTLSGQVFTIIGVMPESFQFPVQASPVNLWTTIALDARSTDGNLPITAQRGISYLDVVARLKPDVNVARAQFEMAGIQKSLNHEYPENRPKGVAVTSEIDDIVGTMRSELLVLFCAVGLVLLIACANLSNLLLARATSRHKEISVCTALGATRWRIVRRLLAEAFLLAAGGAAAGLIFAVFALRLLTRIAPPGLPRVTDSGLNPQVLSFTAVIALSASVVFGLVPALNAGNRQLLTSLNEGGRSGTETRGRKRLRDVFVISEAALAVVLLAGAGLLFRSLLELRKVNPGFAKDHVITFGLDLPARYGHFERVQFYSQLLTQIRRLPGMQAASAGFPLPLSASDVKTSYAVESRPTRQADLAVTTLHVVDDQYFHALGIPLLSGREFTPHDDLSGALPVVVISQALARQAFPGQDPVGRHIKPDISNGPGDAPMRLIVGVVGDVHAEGLALSPIPESYVPYSQLPFAPMAVVARTLVPPESMVPALTKTVLSLDKDLPLLHIKTLDEYVAESVGDTRFEAVLLGAFALLAVVLTCVGLYGVISYLVAQQTREMGIRLALGADRNAIMNMVVRSGLWLSGIGVVIGLGASLLLTRLIAGLLFDVSPLDPLTLFVVPIALILLATLATYIPARRASKVDPIVALRYE